MKMIFVEPAAHRGRVSHSRIASKRKNTMPLKILINGSPKVPAELLMILSRFLNEPISSVQEMVFPFKNRASAILLPG
jgi:hypothetical protein